MKQFLRDTIFYKLYKKLFAMISSSIFGNPAKDMFIIWITWTDWKTTTANIIHKILNDNIWKTVLISTSDIKIWNEEKFNKYKMSSLSPYLLHKYLKIAKDMWCKHAVLEVTSHWIDQNRFYWLDFDLWLLTNITAEHLDYHKTLDNYAKVKKRLFEWILENPKKIKYAVLPKDDQYWRAWDEEMAFDQSITYSLIRTSDVMAENIEQWLSSTKCDVRYLSNDLKIDMKLLGKYNIYNVLSAISVGFLMWIDKDKIIKSINDFSGVAWRMNFVKDNDITYFIDFAHTPNALDSVLSFLNSVKWNWRIITVFGAPWNRDKYKRPLMWQIVDKYSDVIIVTDDDPSTENNMSIISQVIEKIERDEWNNFFILPERKHALKMAVNVAKPWDIVLIAWKGHEKIQLTNFWKREWNDQEKLLEILKDIKN